MYSAYHKDSKGTKGKELVICVVNNAFRIKSQELRNLIFKEANPSAE